MTAVLFHIAQNFDTLSKTVASVPALPVQHTL
jgi:hypothetical protein